MSNTKKIKTKKKKEVKQVDPLTQTVRDTLGGMGRKVDAYQEQLLVQILKSFLVGGLATILDIILYCIFNIFMNPIFSNLLSMVVTILLGLVIGIKYVYDKKNQKNPIIQYLILNGVGLLVTEGMIFGLVSLKDWNAVLVKILAVLLVLVLKIVMRRFIFSKQK